MGENLVRFEVEGKVAVVTMDDGKANALGFGMMDELKAAFARAREEKLAVLLVGRPGALCAGFDLKVMRSGIEGARKMVEAGMLLNLEAYIHPRPVVIACTGHALAGGAIMLLTADSRIGGAGGYKVGLNEVAIGMAMPLCASTLARDRLSKRYLYRTVVEAEIYDPQEAVRAGFLDRLVPHENLLEEAFAHAAKLASYPADSFRETKLSLRLGIAEKARGELAGEIENLKGPQQ